MRRWRQVKILFQEAGQKWCENPSYKGHRLHHHLVWPDGLRRDVWAFPLSVQVWLANVIRVWFCNKNLADLERLIYLHKYWCEIWKVVLPWLVTLNSSANFSFLNLWKWKYLQTQFQENNLDLLLSRYLDFTPYYLYPRLQIIHTGPHGDHAERVSLHWGHNVAVVSFDEEAVNLCHLLASLIVLTLQNEQFALPLPPETVTLMWRYHWLTFWNVLEC